MSTLRQTLLQSRTQYISLEAFDQHIYTYSYNIRTKQGSLALTGVSAGNAAGRVLLRDTGRRLKPSANPGVLTPMISVGFVGASDGLAYNGFIDPQLPDIFALYTEHGSFSNPVSSDLYTSGTNTTGDITTTGVLTTTGGAAVTGGQTITTGGLDILAGGMDVSGTVNINTGSSGVTTINTGGTGATNIGNATGGTAVTGTLTASTGLTLTTGNLTLPTNTGTASGTGGTSTVTVNAMTGTITTAGISTAAGGTHAITLTNSAISAAANRILATVRSQTGTFGTNGIPVIASAICTAASTAVITIGNAHASNALSGAVVLDFIIIR